MRWTVVVASCQPVAVAENTLRAIALEAVSGGVHCIVARSWDDESDQLAAALAGVAIQWVRCPPAQHLTTVRGAGIAAAEADWIAMTEDHCMPGPGWLAAFSMAATTPAVLGGAMSPGRLRRGVDLGAFFAEYGNLGRRRSKRGDGPPHVVLANVAYPRYVVGKVADWSRAGHWDNVIHDRLAAEGIAIVVLPQALVAMAVGHGVREFGLNRFAHGRDYARARSQAWGAGRRVVAAMATPALVPLFLWRISCSTGRDTPWAFLRSCTWTTLFLAAWATGEAAGYLGRNPDV